MKKIFSIIAGLLMTAGVFAQAPQKMSYQAVIRNSNNQLMINQSVGMQVSILHGSTSGTAVYVERQFPTTNSNGLVSIEIGGGTVVSGIIASINWANGPYFVKTETDLNGGANYTITGTSQLLSVPYALHAKTAETVTGVINETDPIFGSSVASGITATDTTNWNTKLDNYTETDPVFGASVAGGITGTDTAFWSNKLDSYTETDPVFGASVASGITGTDTTYWNNKLDSTSLIWQNTGNNIYFNNGNVGIGTTNPNASAKVEIASTTKGFLPSRMTTAQRDAITNPADGLIIFNITSGCPNYYFDGIWYEWCGTGILPLGAITALNCASATNNGILTAGIAASSVNSVIPYTGGNGGSHNGQTVASTGVTGLTTTLGAGSFSNGAATLTYIITGTPSASGSASFALNIGGQTCVFSRLVNLPVGVFTALNCGSATNNGTLTAGVAASGVNSVIPYTGGNGGTHNGQTVASTGVTGLTATLAAGTFANGSGILTYTITGTPSASGSASFAINIGGQTCTLTRTLTDAQPQYPAGSVFCASGATAIIDVTNPTTGKIWMDRNLGATQLATSSADVNSYGDLYQWGRRSDGHQCRTSPTTSALSLVDQPAHGSFIIPISGNNDWRSPQNTNLWQGVNGVNNPCPSGYRLPTETELNEERLSWSANTSAGAFASPLKLPMAGYRDFSNGSLSTVGTFGHYWSSTVSSNGSRYLYFNSSSANVVTYNRANGFSVRCLKD